MLVLCLNGHLINLFFEQTEQNMNLFNEQKPETIEHKPVTKSLNTKIDTFYINVTILLRYITLHNEKHNNNLYGFIKLEYTFFKY